MNDVNKQTSDRSSSDMDVAMASDFSSQMLEDLSRRGDEKEAKVEHQLQEAYSAPIFYGVSLDIAGPLARFLKKIDMLIWNWTSGSLHYSLEQERQREAAQKRQLVPKISVPTIRQLVFRAAPSWPDMERVSEMLAISCEEVARLLENQSLLAILHPSSNRLRFPSWQFQSDNTLVPGIDLLLALFPRHPDPTLDGWDTAVWFMTPRAALDGKSPSECLTDQMERVVELAVNRPGKI